MSETTEKWQRRLLIGSHYAMERFAVLCFIGLAMFVSLGVVFTMHQVKRRSDTFASRAIYNSTFTSSLTGLTGSAYGVWNSEDNTKSALLMKLDSPEVASNDAENYWAVIMSRDENGGSEKIASSPSGNIYVYGSSGFMVVAFDNGDKPFPCQIIECMVRNIRMSTVVKVDESETNPFAKYDIWNVGLNPGATGARKTSAFDSGSFDAEKFYTEVIAGQAENNARTQLAQTLIAMNECQYRIDEYLDRLERDGLNVSEQIPDFYAGDTIVEEDDGSLTFITSTVVPGGFNFDWKNGSVSTGYINQLMVGSDTDSPSTFLAERIASQSAFSYVPGEWHMADGQAFEDYAKVNASAHTDDIRSDIKNLETLFESYAVLKTTYQTTRFNTLLQLEINATSMSENYTENVDCVQIFD